MRESRSGNRKYLLMIGRLTIGFYRLWIRLSIRLFSLLSRGAFHQFGRGSSIRLPIRLVGADKMAVGKNVYIGSGSWLAVRGSEAGVPTITIGDECAFSGYITIAAVKRITIEDRVLIARYVYISDHSHEYRDRDRAILDQGICKVQPVLIKSGSWIGQGAVICPGVTIGRNAVIGANSVVREDVPDYAVAVGAPARVVRYVDRRDEE